METEQFLRLPYGREAVVVSTNGGFKFGGEIVDVITVSQLYMYIVYPVSVCHTNI